MHLYVLAFTTLFGVIFFLSYKLWAGLLLGKEKSKLVPEFSSYLMAGSHGLFISLYALWLLTADDWQNFNSPNTESQNIALALSLGYFIAVRSRQCFQNLPELMIFSFTWYFNSNL
jgi:hypothetical protein